MTTMVYFWLKTEIYLEKVPVITNNTLTRVTSFNNTYTHQSYHTPNFIPNIFVQTII